MGSPAAVAAGCCSQQRQKDFVFVGLNQRQRRDWACWRPLQRLMAVQTLSMAAVRPVQSRWAVKLRRRRDWDCFAADQVRLPDRMLALRPDQSLAEKTGRMLIVQKQASDSFGTAGRNQCFAREQKAGRRLKPPRCYHPSPTVRRMQSFGPVVMAGQRQIHCCHPWQRPDQSQVATVFQRRMLGQMLTAVLLLLAGQMQVYQRWKSAAQDQKAVRSPMLQELQEWQQERRRHFVVEMAAGSSLCFPCPDG